MNDSRYNIYTLIHKGLRASLCQNLVDLGKLDDTDDDAVTHQLDLTNNLLNFCRDHLAHENKFIHPVIDGLDGNPLQTADDHQEHEMEIRELLRKIAVIKNLHGKEKASALHAFYAVFSLFVAENFIHMRIEETHNAQLLWKHFSDEEIHAIEQKIVSSLSPEENLLGLLMVLPNITHSERILFLQGFRQAVSTEIFGATVSVLKPLLSNKDWRKLNQGLNVDQRACTAA